MNTHWSSPKRNIVAAMLDLHNALASGCNAKLVREWNENCTHPIKKKKEDQDFRNYEFSYGTVSCVKEIKENKTMTEFQKHLSLNYISAYGTEEAMKRYYETGELSDDNFQSAGRSHLVHVDDYIKFLEVQNFESGGHVARANMYKRQYRSPEHVNEVRHFFDFYIYKHGSPYAVEKFRRKVWVVELLGKDDPKPKIPVMIQILNIIMKPLKYFPRKRVLKMSKYTLYTFRIGGINNGYSIEFQIPKKFGFE